ncbi:MAG: GNAT family N-acetyltransferase [Planctomycetota bacterium]|nr:MAG: GNAT family N-acetyltransferase [Planctomycetota bacterium]
MDAQIKPFEESHLEAVVRLSLRAWAPVFTSIEQAMDAEVYRHFFPDWRVTQQSSVESACQDPEMHAWVATIGDDVVGFTALRTHADDAMGEIYMIAVDPDHQCRGIAKALTEHACAWLKQAGMVVAMVETGGDPGHGPARGTYESAGFRLFPVARYFKRL